MVAVFVVCFAAVDVCLNVLERLLKDISWLAEYVLSWQQQQHQLHNLGNIAKRAFLIFFAASSCSDGARQVFNGISKHFVLHE